MKLKAGVGKALLLVDVVLNNKQVQEGMNGAIQNSAAGPWIQENVPGWVFETMDVVDKVTYPITGIYDSDFRSPWFFAPYNRKLNWLNEESLRRFDENLQKAYAPQIKRYE